MARNNKIELDADVVQMRGQLVGAFAAGQERFKAARGKYCQTMPIHSVLPEGVKRVPDNLDAKCANGFGLMDVAPELATAITAQGGTLVSFCCDEYVTPTGEAGYQAQLEYLDAGGKRKLESIGAGPQSRQRTYKMEVRP